MRNSLILLVKTLIFISIFNIANSMSCAEFNMKLNTLEDNFNQVFIMNYINENVIYAREKDNFYVYFIGYGFFLKFDKCIDDDATSHIILSTIFSNNKYRFNLNAKLEKLPESYKKIDKDSSNTSDPNFAPLFDQFISRYGDIGVSPQHLRAYLKYIAANDYFFYLDSSDENIKDFISHQKPTSNDDLTLYEYRDLHTDEEAQLTAQSITTPLKVNKEARGTKRRRNELDEDSSSYEGDEDSSSYEGDEDSSSYEGDEDSSSYEGDSHELGGSTIRDNSDIDSCKVNTPMKKDSEYGVLNSSIENSKKVIISNITSDKFTEIQRIFNHLDDDLSIIIEFEEGKPHRKRIYNKLVFEICKKVDDVIYYNIYLYTPKGDILKREYRRVYVASIPGRGVRLQFRKVPISGSGDPIYDVSKDTKPKDFFYVINSYALSLSRTSTKDKSQEIQEHEDQVIKKLNEKYKQSFVSLKNKINNDDLDYLNRLLKKLEDQQIIVFIHKNSRYKSLKYKQIQILKIDKNLYDINISKKEVLLETFKNRTVHFQRTSKKNGINLTIYSPEDNSSISIYNSYLYGPVKARQIK